MEKLLSALKAIPEFPLLLETLRSRQSAAITGAGQINRSHIIATLSRQLAQPVVALCRRARSMETEPVPAPIS